MYEKGHSAPGILYATPGVLPFVARSLGRGRRWPIAYTHSSNGFNKVLTGRGAFAVFYRETVHLVSYQ